MLVQCSALKLFIVSEEHENKTLQSKRTLHASKSPYVKAILEFCDFALSDLTRLIFLFQANKPEFELHRLLPEFERV